MIKNYYKVINTCYVILGGIFIHLKIIADIYMSRTLSIDNAYTQKSRPAGTKGKKRETQKLKLADPSLT